MTKRDYAGWHTRYEKLGSAWHLRLLVVQDLIAQVLDEAPSGTIQVVSVCAGDGRDITTVGRRHRRGLDLAGSLIELDPTNVAAARENVKQAGLDGLRVIRGDAGSSDTYIGTEPADLLLVCGVFGNISMEDVKCTIDFLPALCKDATHIVWTRFPGSGGLVTRSVEAWLLDAEFKAEALVVAPGMFGVGLARFEGRPTRPTRGRRLFHFKSSTARVFEQEALQDH